MEQEGRGEQQHAKPLYYIEQPVLTPFSGPGQSVSVRKNAGGNKRKQSGSKREKPIKKKDQKEVEIVSPEGRQEEEETDEEKNVKEISDNATVQEMLEYIKSLPHFLQPVIACETEDQYLQGTILDAADGEITFQDRRNFSNTVISEKDVTNMYIVSL